MELPMRICTRPDGNLAFGGTIAFELPDGAEAVFDYRYRLPTVVQPSHLTLNYDGRSILGCTDIQAGDWKRQFQGLQVSLLAVFVVYVLRGIIEVRRRHPPDAHTHRGCNTRTDPMVGTYQHVDGGIDQQITLNNPPMHHRLCQFVGAQDRQAV